MNKIELILDNSIFEISQFNANQIAVLNEMVDNNISEEQVCIIAHPSVNELSYSVIYEYLSKGNSITSVEYQKYLNIDIDRINDIIVNVYLGKLHGLSDEQINLYAQRSIYNIKIARLLVENSKDASPEQLNELTSGKFGTQSIVGKQAIQDYINGELSLEQLLSLTYCSEITQDDYNFIKQVDSRTLNIIKDGYNKQILKNSLAKDTYLNQSLAINTNTNICVNKAYLYDNTYIQFDTIDTYNKFKKIVETIREDTYSSYKEELTKDLAKLFNYYKCNFTESNNFIKLSNYINNYLYRYNYDNYYNRYEFEESNFFFILNFYFNDIYIYANRNTEIKFIDEFSTFDEYLEVFMNTNGFKNYIQAKWADKVSEEELNIIKQGKSVLDILCSLYKTKKDKETEIPYLEEHLKDATYKQLKEVICMKENKCSNDEIHLFIEKYLSCTKAVPTKYYNKDNDYNKYIPSISEFLHINDSNNMDLDTIIRLKEAKCTNEEIQYCCTHNLTLNSSPIQPIQREVLNIVMKNNWDNLCITLDDNTTKETINNYNFAVANFKNKPKCIKYAFCNSRYIGIKPHLLKYIDNFDDDTFCLILDYHSSQFVNFCLKMSSITTNYNTLKNIYKYINENTQITDDFINEKVTTDVVIKFCKNAEIDVPEELFENQVESVIEKSVEYFGSSKNFKPIQYDDETIYVDIIGNKELKGSHIITFNKEENDNYEYIFEIAHKEDTLTYTSKITTKKDVTEAINKSIALIENIDEYKEYTEELQEMLKSI